MDENFFKARNARDQANLMRRIRASHPDTANDAFSWLFGLEWYMMKNSINEDETEIFIYDEIGGFFGIPADKFIEELNAITTSKISVRINSPGGGVFDSIAIYNGLIRHSAHVTTYVDAIAASGASIIAMAGDEVVVMTGGQLMIHDALAGAVGNAAEFRDMADFLDQQSNNVASVYAEKAGGTIAKWRSRMLDELWFTAEEAVKVGLADRVYVRDKQPDPTQDDPSPVPETDPVPDDPAPSETDVENVVALMNRSHALAGRGYRYAGRNRAPSPLDDFLEDESLDRFIAQFRNLPIR